MRLLVANPNTTDAVTALVAEAAGRAASPGTQIFGVSARFGPAIIGTRAELAIAEHAALEVLVRHSGGCDAAIVAASTDSGLRAARELLPMPVLGLTESALHVACLLGGRFVALTLSARSAVFARELIEGYGLLGRCAGVRSVPVTPEALLAEPATAARLLAEQALAAVEDGADTVVLVGAVLADMAARLQPEMPVPVVEGVSCAVGLAEMVVRLNIPPARAGSYAQPGGRPSIGLDPVLAARLAWKGIE